MREREGEPSEVKGGGSAPDVPGEHNGVSELASDNAQFSKLFELQAKHPAHSVVYAIALYSLPPDLIGALRKTGFLTDEEALFEKDLYEHDSIGFFDGQSLGRGSDDGLQALQDRVKLIRSLYHFFLSAMGISAARGEKLIKEQEKLQVQTYGAGGAYAGWLVTNRKYREEVKALREQGQNIINTCDSVFPEMPRVGVRPHPQAVFIRKRWPEFYSACIGFYARWCLQTLKTWDWPIPLDVDLGEGILQDRDSLNGAGLFLFLPWHILRGEAIDFRQAIRINRAVPPHLTGWVDELTGTKVARVSHARYRRIWQLYRYYTLSIQKRYPDRHKTRGYGKKLDGALASFLCENEEVIGDDRRRFLDLLGT